MKQSTRDELRPRLTLKKFKLVLEQDPFAFFYYSPKAFANDMYQNKVGYGKAVITEYRNGFATWKLAGEMWTYDSPIVPITCNVLNTGYHKKHSKFGNGILRFHIGTIDDSSMGFWYESEDYTKMISVLKNWCNDTEEMPNQTKFERFFRKLGVEEFDYG